MIYIYPRLVYLMDYHNSVYELEQFWLINSISQLTGSSSEYPRSSKKLFRFCTLGGSTPKKLLNFLKLVADPSRKGPGFWLTLAAAILVVEGEERSLVVGLGGRWTERPLCRPWRWVEVETEGFDWSLKSLVALCTRMQRIITEWHTNIYYLLFQTDRVINNISVS